VEREHLVIGNGSNEILRLIAQCVLNPGDEVVFAWPSFVVYPMVTQMFGATAVKVPLDEDDAHDLPAILAAITERTRIVFLCNPNNPTGTSYRRAEFADFMERVPERVIVVADEAYFEFVTDPDYPDGLEWFDGERLLVVARTFSKIYSLAGLRVGYAVMPAPLAQAVDKVREPFNVNMPAQVAAYYSLGAADEVVRRRDENEALRTALGELLAELEVPAAASQANFVYMHTEKPRDVFEALLDEGIIVRDFGTAPALRVGIGTPEDMDHVHAALGRVAERLEGI
jgi:histidinol-phosphate aminotransferase